MRPKKEVKRYWTDEAGLIVRGWAASEYKHHNPYVPLIEKQWYVYCPSCGKFHYVVGSKEEAKHRTHWCQECLYKDVGKIYTGYAYGDVILWAYECGYKYYEEIGAWVQYYKSYWKKDK